MMKNWIKVVTLSLLALFIVILTPYLSAKASESQSFTEVGAKHILVDTQAEAQALKTRIDNGESFEELAKKYSKCPSGENGGDLGYFERGQMVKEFDDAAFSLPVGKVSEPIHTQFGWHLIKVYARR